MTRLKNFKSITLECDKMKKPIKIRIKKLENNECEVTFSNHISDKPLDYEFTDLDGIKHKKRFIPRYRPQKYGFYEKKDGLIELTKIINYNSR